MIDTTHMSRALALAGRMVGRTDPNPSVGCVIVKDGAVIADAATGSGGRPHAEETALAAAGENARGATIYVTLEPCAQRSAGGVSCSNLLIAAGIARVVIATPDPHPLANGAGLQRLRDAGIEVEIGLMHGEAHALNADWFRKIESGE